jgi:peptide/nickel transport system permease protein
MSIAKKYLAKRIIESLIIIIVVIVFDFVIIHIAPGDPVYRLIGQGHVSDEYVAMIRAKYGLDKSLPEQLYLYLRSMLSGDWGYSVRLHEPAILLIAQRLPATLLLGFSSLALATIIGILLGVLSSRKPNSIIDHLSSLASMIGFSIPPFWLAQILLFVFAYVLGVFPLGGMATLGQDLTGIAYALDVLHHMFLPMMVLTVWYLALTTQLTRANMIETLRKDFITTARAKGLSEWKVIRKHALPNALLPIITRFGINAGEIFAGAIFTETIFSWPGVGRLVWESITARDYPMVMASLVITSIAVISINFVMDLLYVIIDPRIRYTRGD